MTDTTGIRIVSSSCSGMRVETHCSCSMEKTRQERDDERKALDHQFFKWFWIVWCAGVTVAICWFGSRP